MKHDSDPRVLAQIELDLPRLTKSCSLTNAEIETIIQMTEMRLFLEGWPDEGRGSAELSSEQKHLIQEALRAERDALLLGRHRTTDQPGAAEIGHSFGTAYSAWAIVSRVREALPPNGSAAYVLDVVQGRLELKTDLDRQRFQRGITLLARAVQKVLASVFGPKATAEFMTSIRRIRDASVKWDPVSPGREVLGRIGRLRTGHGEDDVRKRTDHLPYHAYLVVKMFEAGASSKQVIEMLARLVKAERSGLDSLLSDEDLCRGQIEFVRALRDIRIAFGP